MERTFALILCFCRFVLSLTQFSVATDTFVIMNELNRMHGDDHDVGLTNLAETAVDYDWVPTFPQDAKTPPNYGTNKLFNYFIIRLIRYLHRQLGQLVLYPACISLFFMTVLSVYNLFEIFQTKWSQSKVQKVGTWLQTTLYSLTFTVITLQCVTLIYEGSEISFMEVMYPHLFSSRADTQNLPSLLLKTGVRSLRGRLVACIFFNLGSLVPDTYLILMRTLHPLRLYVIVNGMKVASSVLTFGAFIMMWIVRFYITASMDPKLMGDRTTIKFMQNDPLVNVEDHYPVMRWAVSHPVNTAYISDERTYLPVFDFKDNLYSRSERTVESMKSNTQLKLTVPTFLNSTTAKPAQADVEFQTNLTMYAFVRSSFSQLRTVLKVTFYMALYFGVASFALAVYGFILVIRRHKLILYVNFLVDFVAIVLHCCHILMALYSMNGVDFFCDIKDYMPASKVLNFEALAVATWMCRAKSLCTLIFSMNIVQILLFLSDIIVLYLLWK
ncbi:HEAT repeat-containing protein 1 [Babesia caballi]|uniref:HEAT repeat-containing protein 1 n=1 Tax=Babesia caballi TaxID=5871 RepID=A0AAV4LWK9_BABCB|nr:HEAT repeat-containing protein 1 [Babesia caballi]